LGPWKNEVEQVAPEPCPETKGTLVLAANRTNRPDILRRFRCYQGGWDIANRHYWAVRTTMIHFHRVFKWLMLVYYVSLISFMLYLTL